MPRITIKDVAKEAGVSAATVSYVMNGRGKVSKLVADKVRLSAQTLGYFPNRTASALKTGRHQMIGCLLPSLANPIFPEIAAAVQTRASELGYATVLVDTGDSPAQEAKALARLSDHGVDGVIAVLNGGFIQVSDSLRFPVVSFDVSLPQYDSVRSDHTQGGRIMAQTAARLGHRRVALFSGPARLQSCTKRREGFLAEAQSLGLELVWEECVPLVSFLPQAAHEALAKREATLIACVNDLVGMATLSAARDLGISVPEELSVLGFDDMQMSAWPLIGLSTIRQPLQELGRQAVDLLLARCQTPDAEKTHVVLPVVPVLRSTTKDLSQI